MEDLEDGVPGGFSSSSSSGTQNPQQNKNDMNIRAQQMAQIQKNIQALNKEQEETAEQKAAKQATIATLNANVMMGRQEEV